MNTLEERKQIWLSVYNTILKGDFITPPKLFADKAVKDFDEAFTEPIVSNLAKDHINRSNANFDKNSSDYLNFHAGGEIKMQIDQETIQQGVLLPKENAVELYNLISDFLPLSVKLKVENILNIQI
jgi:hypothetical protein